jgi:hypothetical protein
MIYTSTLQRSSLILAYPVCEGRCNNKVWETTRTAWASQTFQVKIR